MVIWDVSSGHPLLRLRFSDTVRNAVFTPDGRSLAVTDRFAVVFYPLDSAPLYPERLAWRPGELRAEAEAAAGWRLVGFDQEIADSPTLGP